MLTVKIIEKNNVFGMWKVLESFPFSDPTHRKVLCRCKCGKRMQVLAANLVRGLSTSCGAHREWISQNSDLIADRKIRMKWEAAWHSMLRRTSKTASPKDREGYYDRGIRVCKSWRLSQRRFIEWIVTQPHYDDPKMTLDRKENDWHYCPNNCRLVTQAMQNRNNRRTVWIEWNGERLCFEDFVTKYCKPWSLMAIHAQLKKGRSVAAIIERIELRKTVPNRFLFRNENV
jgi:hypothetical protein